MRVDGRGRIVIPSEVRRLLGIGRVLRLRVEGEKIILEPVKDPLEEVSKLIVKVRIKASEEPERISQAAYKQLVEEFRE